MRSALFACVLLSCSAPGPRPMLTAPRDELAALSWLRGRWCCPFDSVTFCETWRAAPDGALVGEGAIVVDGARGPGGESLRIEARRDGVFYLATPEGEGTTAFRLTRSTREEAVFENPSHDFPSRLVYQRRGDDGLSVRAVGASRTLLFELSRVSSAGTDPPPIRMRQRPLDASFRCDEIAHDPRANAEHATVRFVGDTSGDQGQLVEVGLALSFDAAARRCVAQIASCEHGTTGESATCDGDPLCVRFVGEHVTVERAGRVVFRDLVPISRYELEGAIECADATEAGGAR